ncbi:KH domain-containing protein [Fundicoccus sp. Sow4_H7]|uniref:KH domain-containing protein n=1 Tax=Fundicoccus sp. Sow4_H7 TaxID=3438784 RepID=UPI003F8FB5B0
MPNIEALLMTIIEPLVAYPEDLSIVIEDTADFTEYHIHLNPEDIGRVIGKKGRVARAIRTIIYSIRTNDGKRSRVVIANDNEDATE